MPTYILQLSLTWISVSLAIALDALAIVLLFGIRSYAVWAAALSISAVAPFMLYINARQWTGRINEQDRTYLDSLAQQTAIRTRKSNKALAAIGMALALTVVVSLSLYEAGLLTSSWGATIAKVTTVTLLCILLIPWWSLHQHWFYFFYAAHKGGWPQVRAHDIFQMVATQAAMTTHHTLNRFTFQNYCAVVQGICDKHLAYQGPNSVFMAFPFRPEVRSRMEAIAGAMEKAGFPVVMPPGSDFAEVLVCKLCKSILECEHFLADASPPNRNVLFEFGLASGFRRGRRWLLAVGDIPNSSPLASMFSDTIQVRQSAFDIAQAIARLKTDVLHRHSGDRYGVDRFASPEEVSSRPATAAVVVAPDAFQPPESPAATLYSLYSFEIRRILERKGASLLPLAAASGHRLGVITSAIEHADIVLGVLADDNLDSHEEINSAIAYCLGFALATEKQVAVFQKLPCSRPMMDLYGLVLDFKDAAGLVDIVTGIATDYVRARRCGEARLPLA